MAWLKSVKEEHVARVGRRPWLDRFSAVMVGLVLVFAGFAALGWWLAAAGERAFWQVVGTGIATLVCFSVGLVLVGLASRRRGGLLNWWPNRTELRIYRDRYRR